MKLTSIKSQQKSSDRYSLFIDGRYAFSLSGDALLKSRLKTGQELSSSEIAKYKKLSLDDKLYARTLNLVAARPKSKWEVETYLQRNGASPSLVQDILNKLSSLDLINDTKFAEILVRHYSQHSPASRRKILSKLKAKRVSEEAIARALSSSEVDDLNSLREVVKQKRRQTKYQDDLKLMTYLARQGFNYGDIKTVLAEKD